MVMEEVAPCELQLFSRSPLNSSTVPPRAVVASGAAASSKLATDATGTTDSVRVWRCELRPDVPISWVTALVMASARAVGAGGAPGTIAPLNNNNEAGGGTAHVGACKLRCIKSGATDAASAVNAAGGAAFGGGLTYAPSELNRRAEIFGAKPCISAGLLQRPCKVVDTRKEATISGAALNPVTFCPGLLTVTECKDIAASGRAEGVRTDTTADCRTLAGRVVVSRADPVVSSLVFGRRWSSAV